MTQKKKKLLLTAAALCVLLLAAVGALWFAQGGLCFDRDAELLLLRQADGSLAVSWPMVPSAQSYYVTVQAPAVSDAPLLEGPVAENYCLLPAVESGALRVRVQPVRQDRRGVARTWSVEEMASADWPALDRFTAAVDEAAQTIRFGWEGADGDVFLLCQGTDGGAYQEIARLGEASCSLTVGEGGDLSLPSYEEYEEDLRFAGCSGRRAGDVVFCGALSRPVTFRRSDFLGTAITLDAQPQEENIYDLRWNEAKGDYYMVQYRSHDAAGWTDLYRVEAAETPGCQLKLVSGTDYQLRVVSRAEGQPEDWPDLAQSPAVSLTTGVSALYATVWPVENSTSTGIPTGRRRWGWPPPPPPSVSWGRRMGCSWSAPPTGKGTSTAITA